MTTTPAQVGVSSTGTAHRAYMAHRGSLACCAIGGNVRPMPVSRVTPIVGGEGTLRARVEGMGYATVCAKCFGKVSA